MKKGKFSTTEVACIKGMLSDNISTEHMAKQLDRSDVSIKAEAERITQEALKDQLYIKKTGKGQGGVVVMTENASSQIDAKHNSPAPKTGKSKARRGEWVHTIYEDK